MKDQITMPQYDASIREEEVKNRLRDDYFKEYDAAPILGNVDFAVAKRAAGDTDNRDKEYVVWAESKKGTKHDIHELFVQLILTIGKARTFDAYMPPAYLCAFDARQIAFVEYNDIQSVFHANDFNWNVAPSDHATKEFRQLYEMVRKSLDHGTRKFFFDTDDRELRQFIARLKTRNGKGVQISKNNFVHIFQKWLREVKPSINIDWAKAKEAGLYAADFYRADVMSNSNNESVAKKLHVVLEYDKYVLDRHINDFGAESFDKVGFGDGQVAHRQFWNKYTRPPKEEYWNFIIDRRDLLVPQDAREYEGAFYTPPELVGLSQQYIEDWLGEAWQDNYYVWDCCAGSGNLLVGLTNKYNIYASTKDESDVGIIMQRFAEGGDKTLLGKHVFQFDFLDDSFDKLPQSLQDIIGDAEKRSRLVVYINPPYAEGDSRTGKGRSGVAADTMVYAKYGSFMGYAKREKYIQFLTRIRRELPGCKLCFFSTLKNLQAPKFGDFRRNFRARLERAFVVPASAFDNVDGQFPISFQMWDTACEGDSGGEVVADVYDAEANPVERKTLVNYDGKKLINDWTIGFVEDKHVTAENFSLGTIIGVANDFQNQATVRIERPHRPWNHQYQWQITRGNLMESCIYFSVRLCVPATWLNDRDQFLYPDDGWQADYEFQTDCLVYTLFHGQNRVSSADGTNHWIPFTEAEVDAKEKFQSHFMSDYLNGKQAAAGTRKPSEQSLQWEGEGEKAEESRQRYVPCEHFSAEARAVMQAGRELWRYYHAQPTANPDASYYDIRLHFQGTKLTKSGKEQMNPGSADARYTELITELRRRLKVLAARIEPKVYEYGFLKK